MPRGFRGITRDVAVFDNKLWLLEGHDGKGNRNDVWYSSDGASWMKYRRTLLGAGHAASVFVYNDALWMVVGNNMQPDVWKMVHVDGRR